MKVYLPEIFLVIVGLLMMALLLYLGAAVVYHGWQRQFMSLSKKVLGKGLDGDGGNFPG